jgi:hypothetical protein
LSLGVPQGNIELANLLSGSRDAFDHLLDELQTEPVASLDHLDLSYRASAEPLPHLKEGWRLTNGELRGDCLQLGFQGTAPELDGAALVVAGREFPLVVSWSASRQLEVKLSTAAESLLERPVPILIRWISDGETNETNPIFACHRAALDEELREKGGGVDIVKTGGLDLDDEEMEGLLGELDAALTLDRRSVWQLAGRALPTSSDDEDGDHSLRLDYADIDYEMLRQHPKIQQYRRRAIGTRYDRTRLQIILSAITDHFRGLLGGADMTGPGHEATAILEEGKAETEEEREQEEEEKQKRKVSQSKKVAKLLRGFIRRYLRGLQSPDFIEFAGYEVMSQNYVIFAHILFRLFVKEWLEAEFLVESLLETWTFFWGEEGRSGYYRQLDPTKQAEASQWFQEYHSAAEQLAALYCSGQLAARGFSNDLRFKLRDFCRGYILDLPFEPNSTLLEETWRIVATLYPYEPPRPLEVVKGLKALADFETEYSFLRAITTDYGLPAGSCSVGWVRIAHRKHKVECIEIHAHGALPDSDVAREMLQDWMRFEKLDYYRIHSTPTGRVAFYDVQEKQGTYWAPDSGILVDFGALSPARRPWHDPLDEMHEIASELNTQLTLPVVDERVDAGAQKDPG